MRRSVDARNLERRLGDDAAVAQQLRGARQWPAFAAVDREEERQLLRGRLHHRIADVGVHQRLPDEERGGAFGVIRRLGVHLLDVVHEDKAAQPERLRFSGWHRERGDAALPLPASASKAIDSTVYTPGASSGSR